MMGCGSGNFGDEVLANQFQGLLHQFPFSRSNAEIDLTQRLPLAHHGFFKSSHNCSHESMFNTT
jgi:hypothetical protein